MSGAGASRPFFSKKLVVCGADGSNSDFEIRKLKRLRAFQDRLELGKEVIPYGKLLDLRVAGNVVSLEYSTGAGIRREANLRYDKFLPWGGEKALLELVDRVGARWKPFAMTASFEGSRASRAELVPGAQNSQGLRVRVSSSRVAFPARCPACHKSANRVRQVSAGPGLWLVPSCAQHSDLKLWLGVDEWSRHSSEVVFRFGSEAYGREFLSLNEAPPRPGEPIRAAAEQALRRIPEGARFVVYSYVVSLGVVTLRRASGVVFLDPGQNPVLSGVPYSLISLLLGWWGIPWGPVFTVQSVFRNTRGGTDVTATALEALRETPVAAVCSRARQDRRVQAASPSPAGRAYGPSRVSRITGKPCRINVPEDNAAQFV